MYADDMKIFLSYSQLCEQAYLQEDLDSFYTWCKLNLMELNYGKCKYMRFFRMKPMAANYVLGSHPLEKVDTFLDLGVLMDSKLNFISHITLTINKAKGVLGFIKRWAKEFNDPYVTKTLYTSLVRPILEYASIIWDPIYQTHADSIESVQKQFLLFCLRSLNFNPLNLPSYSSRLALIKLPTLKSRRTMLNISFLLNVINGDVCAGFLINNISFNIPLRPTRHFSPLSVNICKTNYANADPLTRMSKEFNNLFNLIDFNVNLNLIKSNIIIFLNS